MNARNLKNLNECEVVFKYITGKEVSELLVDDINRTLDYYERQLYLFTQSKNYMLVPRFLAYRERMLELKEQVYKLMVEGKN